MFAQFVVFFVNCQLSLVFFVTFQLPNFVYFYSNELLHYSWAVISVRLKFITLNELGLIFCPDGTSIEISLVPLPFRVKIQDDLSTIQSPWEGLPMEAFTAIVIQYIHQWHSKNKWHRARSIRWWYSYLFLIHKEKSRKATNTLLLQPSIPKLRTGE